MPKLTGRTMVSLVVFCLVLILALAGQANATIINDFSQLMELGYTRQNINNYSHGNFSVEGNAPTLDYSNRSQVF